MNLDVDLSEEVPCENLFNDGNIAEWVMRPAKGYHWNWYGNRQAVFICHECKIGYEDSLVPGEEVIFTKI